MHRIILCCFIFYAFCNKGFTQPVNKISTDSLRLLHAKEYYKLALQYKNGEGVSINYLKAFSYFSKAAELDDDQSIYAIGYMHYKGLGCVQDYALAAKLFARGAYKNRDNSMYFYALCLRNGYGITKNEDSAQYWLNKAAAAGYSQAYTGTKNGKC